MDKDMELYKYSHPDSSFVNSIFSYDVRELEQTNDLVISKFIIALSQYLIYFKAGYNETKRKIAYNERLLETSISQLLSEEDVKKYKTKKDARANLIFYNPDLSRLQNESDALEDELFLLEGIDKTISELIAAFKRELTRRENELYQQRHSRS